MRTTTTFEAVTFARAITVGVQVAFFFDETCRWLRSLFHIRSGHPLAVAWQALSLMLTNFLCFIKCQMNSWLTVLRHYAKRPASCPSFFGGPSCLVNEATVLLFGTTDKASALCKSLDLAHTDLMRIPKQAMHSQLRSQRWGGEYLCLRFCFSLRSGRGPRENTQYCEQAFNCCHITTCVQPKELRLAGHIAPYVLHHGQEKILGPIQIFGPPMQGLVQAVRHSAGLWHRRDGCAFQEPSHKPTPFGRSHQNHLPWLGR